MEYRTYEYEFKNRNDGRFRTCVLCICPVPEGTPLTGLRDTMNVFFSSHGCETGDNDVGEYNMKCPKGNRNLACVFYPVLGLRKEDTGKHMDAVLRYTRTFIGVETTFDDYMRMQKEFKEQYEEI